MPQNRRRHYAHTFEGSPGPSRTRRSRHSSPCHTERQRQVRSRSSSLASSISTRAASVATEEARPGLEVTALEARLRPDVSATNVRASPPACQFVMRAQSETGTNDAQTSNQMLRDLRAFMSNINERLTNVESSASGVCD